MRKMSKTSKKGCLEKIYKEWTLPQVLFKNFGLCVVCQKNKAECGHHIRGRSKSYFHIHPDFVVPVCLKCHTIEKGLNMEQRVEFLNKANQWFYNHLEDASQMVKDFMLIKKDDCLLEEWATDKLIEFGFHWR